MVKARAKLVLGVAVALVAVVVVAYLALTYPRVLVSFTSSFTVGADFKREEFEVPFLHEYVKVEVHIQSGNAFWTAKISSGDTVIWSHNTQQSRQTTYTSEWIKLASGRYNFTFATAGLGSLTAEVKLTSKGGFW